jgi:hypothetical protein
MEWICFSNVLEMKDMNSFLYQFEVWTTLQSTWIELNQIELNSKILIKIKYIEWKLSSIELDSNSTKFNWR